MLLAVRIGRAHDNEEASRPYFSDKSVNAPHAHMRFSRDVATMVLATVQDRRHTKGEGLAVNKPPPSSPNANCVRPGIMLCHRNGIVSPHARDADEVYVRMHYAGTVICLPDYFAPTQCEARRLLRFRSRC